MTSFKDQLKSAGPSREERVISEMIDELYDSFKAECMRCAELGFTQNYFYVKEKLVYNANDRRRMYDLDLILRHKIVGKEFDCDAEDWKLVWMFKDPDQIIKRIEEKLRKDDLLDSSKITTKNGALFLPGHRKKYADAVRDIVIYTSW